MNPLPLRERITGALRLEPMTISELARVLCACRRDVGEELVIMRARGDVHELPNWAGWVNTPRRVLRVAA
ncbi:hypothetical protein [Frateuria terrea]|uniref:Uncharacterized protein n=1 Tax=Frateuria terrea TaxID=529704 RepID=A0A1H7A2Q4_9GAMM|nr:hypothetical protein [Frateuria terrea]SEJ55345.1 hypothetical protein SAMN04487997_0194 [Frateuria terrea]SFP47233.1 hypothetical protein SAMN02927913_2196 [Frateuria terrea]